jgi:DNA-directed RNA polymerase beta' subunit
MGNLTELSFDGDEMNLHMPQDVEAETELRNLAAVPYQIISPANNSPIIGIYQVIDLPEKELNLILEMR